MVGLILVTNAVSNMVALKLTMHLFACHTHPGAALHLAIPVVELEVKLAQTDEGARHLTSTGLLESAAHTRAPQH